MFVLYGSGPVCQGNQMKCSATCDGRDDRKQRQFACDDGGRTRSADGRGGLSRQVPCPAGIPWRQDGRGRGAGSGRPVGPCADAEARGRHGRVQQHRVAQAVGLVQTGSAATRPDSPGSGVPGAKVGNDRDVEFIPDGDAGLNGGSENPGALHPTRQGRPARRA